MANTRALATASLLLTLASGTSIATSTQDMAAQAKTCKALSDDKQRLKCFDHLFAETPKPEKSEEGKQANWSIEETKSPDGSRQVVAANLVNDTVLILRCKDQITEAAFSTQYNYLGWKDVDVELRINDQNPVKEVWKASVNGRAAFAPDAVAFIQSLPDNGRLSIRATRSSDGKVKEGRFNLGAVSEVRRKIAKACDWTNGTVDEPAGSVDHQ
jgi:Type VI secretion system VasI, EvfG, VC_A0118